MKNGCSFFQGGKKPRKTHPTVALSDMSRECPYPAPGLDSVLLITACLAAERKSLKLFTLGFPQQLFGTAPTPYLHAWKLVQCQRLPCCLHQTWDLYGPIVAEGLAKTPLCLCTILNSPAAKGPAKVFWSSAVKVPSTGLLSFLALAWFLALSCWRMHSSALPWVQHFPPSRAGWLSGK